MSEKNECLRNGIVVWGNDFANEREVFEIFKGKEFEKEYLGRSDWYKIKDEKKVIAFLIARKNGNGWHDYLEWGERNDGRRWKEVMEFKSCQETNTNVSENFMNTCLYCSEVHEMEFYAFLVLKRQGARWCKFAGVFGFDEHFTRAYGGMPPSRIAMNCWDDRYVTFFRRKDVKGWLGLPQEEEHLK